MKLSGRLHAVVDSVLALAKGRSDALIHAHKDASKGSKECCVAKSVMQLVQKIERFVGLSSAEIGSQAHKEGDKVQASPAGQQTDTS